MHLPERALVGGGLGGLGGELGVRVDVVERQVPPDVADVAEVAQELADDRLGLAAVRALEVAVLDEGDRRASSGPRMWSRSGIDVDGEVDERRPPSRAARGSAGARGSSAVDAEQQPGERRDAPSAALRMPIFASSSCCPSKASVAMSSATVKPMPAIVPPPATAAQPTGGRSRPRVSRVAEPASCRRCRPACRRRSRARSRA